ncbi:MAG: hypothetical protein ACNYNX_12270 [Leucobacter sp.]
MTASAPGEVLGAVLGKASDTVSSNVLGTVLGTVEARGIGTVLAAETPLRASAPEARSAARPATDVEFELAPVAMPMLGRLLMGARNRDDRTLAPADAEAALGGFSRAGGGAVVALAGRRSDASGAELARLSAVSGVAIIRGAAPAGSAEEGDPEAHAARILAELDASRHPAGVVGLVRAPGEGERAPERRIGAAATAAHRAGAALVLEAGPDPATAERSLAAVDAAGLARERVILTGVTRALGGSGSVVGGSAGARPGRLEALLALGTALCFDDLGRIPTVRTIVSDFDAALAILGCAERGAAERVTLSCGIRNKHRLTAYGGNGLEFVGEQFLPLLARLGADEALVAAVGGGNAARILARRVPGAAEETP